MKLAGPFVTAAALAAVVAFAPAALAQDKLPFNPYSDVKVGDWALLQVSIKGEGAETRTIEEKVAKVEGDQVTVVSRNTEVANDEPAARVFSKKDGASVEALTGLQFTSQNVTDDVHEVGGRKFKCKKLVLKNPDQDVELWLSPEVKLGYVHMIIKEGDLPSGETVLLGFGSEGKTEWGKSAAEAAAAPKDVKPSDVGVKFGVDVFSVDEWIPRVTIDETGVLWEHEGYMGTMGLHPTPDKIDNEEQLKSWASTHSATIEKIEGKKTTDKGWYVVTKHDKYIDFMYVMKLDGKYYVFTAGMTPEPKIGDQEIPNIVLEDALKVASTIKAHKK